MHHVPQIQETTKVLPKPSLSLTTAKQAKGSLAGSFQIQEHQSNTNNKISTPFVPLPAKALGKTLSSATELNKLADTLRSENVPCVFVLEKVSEGSSRSPTLLGADFLERSFEREFESPTDSISFTEEIEGIQEIVMLFPNGQYKSADVNQILRLDPSGHLTRALLKFHTEFFVHEFDEAEIRVKVAAAFLLSTFGFIDQELACSTLLPVGKEAFSVGVHRTFIESIESSNRNLATLMIKWGADVNLPAEDDGLLAITSARRLGKAEMVTFLIEMGSKH